MQPFPEVDNACTIVIPLPGYSDLGTANVYAVGSGPVTLIDTAPKFPGSFESLKDQLEQGGRELVDIERIVLTHGHVDHFGLAARIREEVGRAIPCFIHAEERWRVTAESYREELFDEAGERLMAMVDMPTDEVEKIRERFSLFTLLCDPVLDARAMEDGDVFEGDDYQLRVIHTPGHTPGTCCLYETRQKILFSGDHIIKHITPNPLFELRKEILRDPGYQSLTAYIRSLEKVKGIDVRYVFPGHGGHARAIIVLRDEFLPDLRVQVRKIRRRNLARATLVYNLVNNGDRRFGQDAHRRDDDFEVAGT